ncbi:MAG: hypothetical protein RSB97_06570, partial [Christensenella sp.]
EGAWVSGSAGVGLQANITKTAAVTGALEVFVSANSAATTGTNIPAPTGIFAPNTYKLPAASGLLETGKLYLIAQEAGNTANRAVQEFNIIRDIYSPRLSGLLATKTAGGGFDVTLNATDSQSGVKAVFASTSPTAPPIGGRVNLTKGSDAANSWSGKLSAPTAGSAWYIYAVDNVGNMSAAGLAVEQAARRIGIYSYDDMKKIGVDKAYPLSGDYIQMNDFAIPDGTAHTPIGSNGAPFTGTYDGGGFTVTGGKNMTWNDSARGDWGPVYGLFGDFCGTMRNLNVKDITMTKSGDSVAIAQYGILAGATHGATISDVTISNCAIDIDVAVTNELQVGAIGETYSSSLERVNVNNISIKVNAGCPVYVGGLMGVVEGGNVKDCLVTNPIITAKSVKNVYVGGFVGACAYQTGRGDSNFINSRSEGGKLSADSLSAGSEIAIGGFIGLTMRLTSYFENCSTSTEITRANQSAANSYVYGGGFFGIDVSQKATFKNCVASGRINVERDSSVAKMMGGFGGTLGSTTPDNAELKFINCKAMSSMNLNYTDTVNLGGFIGTNYAKEPCINKAGVFEGNLYRTDALAARFGTGGTMPNINTNQYVVAGINPITAPTPVPSPVNITALNTPVTVDSAGDAFGYSGVRWEFENAASVAPYFELLNTTGQTVKVRQKAACPAPAEITLKAYYSKSGYNEIAQTVKVMGVIAVPDYNTFIKIGTEPQNGYTNSRSYLQTQDFTIPDNAVHTPIGNFTTPFTGTYDGGNRSITGGKNMTWNKVQVWENDASGMSPYGTGLFGTFCGIAKNLTLKDVDMSILNMAARYYSPFISLAAKGSSIENVTVDSSTVSVIGTTDALMGGITSYTYGGTSFRNCIVKDTDLSLSGSSTVDGNYVGGISCGFVDARVSSCKVIGGSVTAKSTTMITLGGFSASAWGGNTITDCSSSATVYYDGSKVDSLLMGGFIGDSCNNFALNGLLTTMKNCSATGKVQYNGLANVTNKFIGGFVGNNAFTAEQTVKVYSGNVFTANDVTDKVSPASLTPTGTLITDDMIRMTGSTTGITLSDLKLTPAANTVWVNGAQKVGAEVGVTVGTAVTGGVDVFVTADKAALSGINLIKDTSKDGIYTLAAANGLTAGGKLYVVAQSKTDNTVRAALEFNLLRDVYSPRVSDVKTQMTGTEKQNVSAKVTDTQSGVREVYASMTATGAKPADAGSTAFERIAGGESWGGALSVGTWYIYAIDRVGNYSDAPVKAVVTQSDLIPIYSYADLAKIGMAAGYPLSGKYIQMNDFKIPD